MNLQIEMIVEKVCKSLYCRTVTLVPAADDAVGVGFSFDVYGTALFPEIDALEPGSLYCISLSPKEIIDPEPVEPEPEEPQEPPAPTPPMPEEPA